MDARPGGFRPTVVPPAASGVPSVASGAAVPVDLVDGQSAARDQLVDIDARLAQLSDLEIADQVQVFAEIHHRLRTALAGTGGASTAPSDPLPSRGR